MIGCFPDPYPDELLYSVCARYQQRTRFSCINTNLELFSCETKRCFIDLPGFVDVLAENLPGSTAYNMNYFLKNNSLLPLYLPFLTKELKSSLLSELTAPGQHPKFTFSYDAYSLISKRLRYCPQCVHEDRLIFGETYWHRLPQVWHVRVCPKHLIILIESDISIERQYRGRFYFVENYFAAEDVISCESQISSESNHYLNTFRGKVTLELARNAQWLLEFGNLNWSHENSFREQYAYMTAAKLGVPLLAVKLPSHVEKYNVNSVKPHYLELLDNFSRLRDLFVNYFSHEFLCGWECPIPKRDSYRALESYWVYSLINERFISSLPPQNHFLFMYFLGTNVSTCMSGSVNNFANLNSPYEY